MRPFSFAFNSGRMKSFISSSPLLGTHSVSSAEGQYGNDESIAVVMDTVLTTFYFFVRLMMAVASCPSPG